MFYYERRIHMDTAHITEGLEPRKAALINNFANIARGRGSDEMLPLLLAVSNKAKKEGISFTQDETNAIINILRNDMSPEQQGKLDLFMQMLKNA